MAGTIRPRIRSDSAAKRRSDSVTVEADVEHVLYSQDDSGFAVVRLRRTGGEAMVAVGPLLGSQPGESLRLTGSFQDHPKYGRRFQVDTFASIAPSTVAGLERYLGSGLIPGIGATYAKRIVATFGLQTLDVLDHESRRLREVPGIGAKRAAALAEASASTTCAFGGRNLPAPGQR